MSSSECHRKTQSYLSQGLPNVSSETSKQKKTNKLKKQKQNLKDEAETETKRSNIWQGILLILYRTSLDILLDFAHKFS